LALRDHLSLTATSPRADAPETPEAASCSAISHAAAARENRCGLLVLLANVLDAAAADYVSWSQAGRL
jgi:hypothetical protein